MSTSTPNISNVSTGLCEIHEKRLGGLEVRGAAYARVGDDTGEDGVDVLGHVCAVSADHDVRTFRN